MTDWFHQMLLGHIWRPVFVRVGVMFDHNTLSGGFYRSGVAVKYAQRTETEAD